MSPDDVMRDILIGDMNHVGRGDYSIIFKVNSTQAVNIEQTSVLEYIHRGRLRLDDIIYSGKNPYGVLSSLDDITRNKITNTQIDSRGGCHGR